MKLQHPFIQLPLLFDAAALAAEIGAIEEAQWIPHPQGFPGNSALPLVAVRGDGHDDGVEGPMRPTPLLERLPYVRGVLARLGTVVGRTRLMRLSGDAEVKMHVDQGYYWAERVRVHVPIVTTPTVRFYCGDAEINMAAGECWIFDTWRRHRVHNDAVHSRIHLVVDTVGGDGLWELIARGRPHHVAAAGWAPQTVAASAADVSALEFEAVNLPKVMSPWELRSHIGFLFAEAKPHRDLPLLQKATVHFLHRWLSLWAAHGDADAARPRYETVLNDYIGDVRQLGREITLRNDLPLPLAMQAMVARAALSGGKFVAGTAHATRGERVGAEM